MGDRALAGLHRDVLHTHPVRVIDVLKPDPALHDLTRQILGRTHRSPLTEIGIALCQVSLPGRAASPDQVGDEPAVR